MPLNWFERLLSSIADRGRAWIRIPTDLPPLGQLEALARNLVSETGEASGAALARAVLERYHGLSEADRGAFFQFAADEFAPEPAALREAAEAYLAEPSPETAARLGQAAEAPRQELLRRLNMAPDGTATLVAMRQEILRLVRTQPALAPLEADLHHLLTSWFNRGFLELRRIDWHTPADVLEKLIVYEAVHEITGWDDLRRRLAADRRCFGFFHPALHDEPLIFVEVALVHGLAGSIQKLLEPAEAPQETVPDTAIFYSISNCQSGLRGISFGNFLIKQVVEDLKAELPGLNRFATLSPVPGFRAWLDQLLESGARHLLLPEERVALAGHRGISGAKGAFKALLAEPGWPEDAELRRVLEAPLTRLCAVYLTRSAANGARIDPVARFHLGNGARLERIHFLGNPGPRGLEESYGMMVNYLYDPERIEAHHEAFQRQGRIAQSREVTALLPTEPGPRLNLAGSRHG